MEINPPEVLRRPIVVPKKTLMGPGPSNCSPRVVKALSLPILGHMHPEVFKIMDDVKEGIKYIFQTKNTLTLALSSSGHGGMEAVFCNLLEKNDRVVIAQNGIWGERATIMATNFGMEAIKVEVAAGLTFTTQQIEHALKLYKPAMLFIVQGESSTGVYQPLEGFGQLCHKYNCLFAVDAVASLGSVPLYADRWEIDAVYTGSQKVLGAPPGITPISFSSRAELKLRNRKLPVPVYYLDMNYLGDYWNCFGNGRIYHHTISSTLLYGLREALAMVVEEGIENVINRHVLCAQRLYEGLKSLNIKLFVEKESARLPTVTTILPPYNLDWQSIVDYAMKNYSLEVSGGLGPTTRKVIRIGIMGYNANNENVDLVLKVLQSAIDSLKGSL